MALKVSVIIPCRNESRHIGSMLRCVLRQDYGRENLEILVADGMSDDDTPEIVERIAADHPQVKLIENSERVVPYALNRALKAASGDVIVRMDAHCEYPIHYVSRLVEVLLAEGADNTGGVCDTRPGSDTPMAAAIALATTSPFGVGSSRFRTGADAIMEVDTVPFGCYRREVFDRIGVFDPDLIRNQDDEFNARLVRAGGKILLVPDVVITYFARPTLFKLMSMFYQYGLFKPLAVKKAGGAVTFRQFAPPIFVLANIGGLALGFVNPLFWWIILGVNGLHLGAGSWIGLKEAIQRRSAILPLLLPLVFYAIHWAYGWGYVVGVFRFILRDRRPNPASIELSR